MSEKNEDTGIGAMNMTIAHGPDKKKKEMPKLIEPDAKFGGTAVFDCDADTFRGCLKGRKKGQRWTTFLDQKSDWVDGVRTWAKKNKNADFLLRNRATGHMMYAQKGNQPQKKA